MDRFIKLIKRIDLDACGEIEIRRVIARMVVEFLIEISEDQLSQYIEHLFQDDIGNTCLRMVYAGTEDGHQIDVFKEYDEQRECRQSHLVSQNPINMLGEEDDFKAIVEVIRFVHPIIHRELRNNASVSHEIWLRSLHKLVLDLRGLIS